MILPLFNIQLLQLALEPAFLHRHTTKHLHHMAQWEPYRHILWLLSILHSLHSSHHQVWVDPNNRVLSLAVQLLHSGRAPRWMLEFRFPVLPVRNDNPHVGVLSEAMVSRVLRGQAGSMDRCSTSKPCRHSLDNWAFSSSEAVGEELLVVHLEQQVHVLARERSALQSQRSH